jgi:hypothetical protein
MNKKVFVLLAAILLILIVITGYFWFGNVYRLNNKIVTGKVEKLNANYWGLETTFPRHKLSIKDFPAEFQKENSIVSCKISISDVIGTNDWDVYAEASDCVKK